MKIKYEIEFGVNEGINFVDKLSDMLKRKFIGIINETSSYINASLRRVDCLEDQIADLKEELRKEKSSNFKQDVNNHKHSF